jgi:undecaprenyl-diphosphatase
MGLLDAIMAFLAQYFYLVVAALAVLYLFIWYRSRWMELAVAAAFIGVVAYALSKVCALLIESPRPFVVTSQPALIASATDNGFPSDHTLLVGVLAMLVTLVSWRAGLVFWALALVVGLARVYAGVHHLVDVLGSLVIVGIAGGLYLLARWVWESRRKGRSAAT